MKNFIATLLIGLFVWTGHAEAQGFTPGLTLVPMGVCQIPAASLSSAVGFSACQAASTTASCSGSTLTAGSTSGEIKIGHVLSGTGITAGTTVVSYGPNTTGGNGTYILSAACTSSSNTVTASGIPSDAQGHMPNLAVLYAETANVRWRDDGAPPTASIGMVIPATSLCSYVGTMTAIEFIAATGSPVLDVAFYRSP